MQNPDNHFQHDMRSIVLMWTEFLNEMWAVLCWWCKNSCHYLFRLTPGFRANIEIVKSCFLTYKPTTSKSVTRKSFAVFLPSGSTSPIKIELICWVRDCDFSFLSLHFISLYRKMTMKYTSMWLKMTKFLHFQKWNNLRFWKNQKRVFSTSPNPLPIWNSLPLPNPPKAFPNRKLWNANYIRHSACWAPITKICWI